MVEPTLETLLRRDRAIIAAALATVAVLSWIYILRLAADMDMRGMDMAGWRMTSSGLAMVMTPAFEPWTAEQFVLMCVMWSVMMIGMMTPSVALVILTYARVGRQAAAQGTPLAATG